MVIPENDYSKPTREMDHSGFSSPVGARVRNPRLFLKVRTSGRHMGVTIGAMLEEVQALYPQHNQPCFLYLSSEVIKVLACGLFLFFILFLIFSCCCLIFAC